MHIRFLFPPCREMGFYDQAKIAPVLLGFFCFVLFRGFFVGVFFFSFKISVVFVTDCSYSILISRKYNHSIYAAVSCI